MNKISATIAEVEQEIAALRDGKGRSRVGMTNLLRDVLDALWVAGVPEAKQAGCRCAEEPCKYPLCHANRS